MKVFSYFEKRDSKGSPRMYMYVCSAVLVIIFSSCNKFLDTTPTDRLVREDYYDTEDKLMSALAGVYYTLSMRGIYGDIMHTEFSISDLSFWRPSATSSGLEVYDFDYANAKLAVVWEACFLGIERANTLIRNIDVVEIDDRKRQAILGEVLFLRGYFYYILVMNFGAVPLKLVPTVSPSGEDVQLPRTSVTEVYQQIIEDMETAEKLVFPISELGFSGRVSQSAVRGILARVNLTMAGYPLKDESRYSEVLKWCNLIIASGEHALNLDYKQLFVNMHRDLYDVKESIWEVEFKGNASDGFGSQGRVGFWGGIQNQVTTGAGPKIGYSYGYLCVTKKLFDLFDDGDLRRDWSIGPYSYIVYDDRFYYNYFLPAQIYNRNPGKFRREVCNNDIYTIFTAINFPLLRYADVLLMFAEAENFLNGPTPAALSALNQVRRRGFGLDPNTPTSAVSVVSGITLSTNGNMGYNHTINNIPISFIGGGGTGATGEATVFNGTTGASFSKVIRVAITNPGNGYSSVPEVVIGQPWSANTSYSVGQQIFFGSKLYTVKTAGFSTDIGPAVL